MAINVRQVAITVVSVASQYGDVRSLSMIGSSALPPTPPVPPSLTNFVPAVMTPIGTVTRIKFRLNTTALQVCTVIVKFAGYEFWEGVHDGVDFAPAYAAGGSTRVVVPGIGFDYDVWRVGGWPDTPGFYPVAVDTAGQVNP